MNKSFLKCITCNSKHTLADSNAVYGCKNRKNDDLNHILEKYISRKLVLPSIDEIIYRKKVDTTPYSIFCDFFFLFHLAEQLNVDYKAIISDIDNGLRQIGEPPFKQTPIHIQENNIFIKDKTANVIGSHKARHLMGNILYLEILVRSGTIREKPKLAVYSCGNAAMGAAAVAKAAGYNIDVFIPPNVSSKITDTLKRYGASIVICPRDDGEIGDPCYNLFQKALLIDSVPFSCSGPDNWSNIKGGQTLCLEFMTQLLEMNITPESIVIQVGGGALASSAIKSLEELYDFGYIKKIPSVYTVQTEGSFPLTRAFYLLIKEIAV